MCTWYVVFKGKKPGVYTNWAECSDHVLGIVDLCIRSTTLMMKQWMLSTQQSTQSLLLNLLPFVRISGKPRGGWIGISKNFYTKLKVTCQQLSEVSTVWVGTPDVVRSFDVSYQKSRRIREINYKCSNELCEANNLQPHVLVMRWSCPSVSLTLERHQFIDQDQNLRNRLRERDNKEQIISSNHNNNEHAGHKDLSRCSTRH
jgi:hypothetical protein